MEEENGNGNWRQEIRRLNLEYLNIVKQIGTMPEQRDYVQTVLRLDDDMLKLLMSLAAEELNKMADVGMPLFRLKLADLKIFQNLNQKGNADRATRLLSAALVADGAEEGEIMIAQEISAWSTAMAMIKVGLRPPIVHAATGLCRNRLRRAYRAVHGKPAVQGRVPEHAYNRLRTKSQVIEATTYYQIYYGLGGDRIFQVLDNHLFIEAYQEYKAIAPGGIDGTTAWYIARDLRENILTARRCQACGRIHLYDPRSEQMTRCPLCVG